MKTTIIIHELHVSCILGVSEKERLQKQRVFITVKMTIDADKSVKTDNIEDTVNYRDVYNKIIASVASSHFRTLEALSYSICDICLQFPGVQKVIVSTTKPTILENTQGVSVEIEREHE